MRLTKAKGFTLLELLVTMGILAITISIVSLSVGGQGQQNLKFEGEKLAARLNGAHAQMMAGASPLRLVVLPTGYGFETLVLAVDGSAQADWRAVTNDDVLKPRVLPDGASLVLQSNPQTKWLQLEREPITLARSMMLSLDGRNVVVATDGVQGWAVQ